MPLPKILRRADDDDGPAPARSDAVRRLVRDHLRPHRWRIVAALGCMAVVAACTAAMALMMEPLVDMAFEQRDLGLLELVAGLVVVVFVVKGLGTYGQSVLMNDVGRRVIADLQNRMFHRLIRADLATFHATPSGQLLSRFVYDVNLLNSMVAGAVTGIGLHALSVIALVGSMFHLDAVLAAVVFLVFPAAMLPIVTFGRRMRRVSHKTQTEVGQLTSQLGQVFQGIRHVKAYNAEDREAEAAATVIWRLARLNQKAARIRAMLSPIMEALGGVAIAAVMLYGGYQVMEGTRTPGTFFAFITAVLLAYQPMRRLAGLNTELQQGLAAADRVFMVIDAEPSITDRPGAQVLTRAAGRIELRDVSFAYHPEAPALHGVSIEVRPGRTVALVGPSGAGKSTILNLIPRFYDVGAGAVLIDGHDVRSLTLTSLRDQIALVSQEITLFDDTVRNNIAYSRPDAGFTEIEAAARLAAAHDFIVDLPKGYDTMIGEGGVKLSGGQRQRLSIARAVLKNAPILLLDEATSALDTESERLVQEALSRLRSGRATLVIAHRLSTIMTADWIYVLDEGRVVETGTHAGLIARGGLYARLWSLQTAMSDVDAPAAEPLAALGE